MNALIARLGHPDSRRAVQTIWLNGKRRGAGGEWTCTECTRQSRHKRMYSDAISWTGAGRPSIENLGDEPAKQEGWSGFAKSPGRRRESERLVGRETRQEESRAEASSPGEGLLRPNEERNSVYTAVELESLWGQHATDASAESELGEGSALGRVARRVQFVQSNLTKFDYRSTFATALAKGEADLVAHCLFAAESAKDIEFLGDMSDSTFSAVLELLQPEKYIKKLASIYVQMSPALVDYLDLTPMWKIASEYASMLEQIFSARRDKDRKPGLRDYRVMLRSARELGDKRMAKLLWTMLHEDSHRPDTACFNDFMASVVWNGIHDAVSRKRRRVITYFLSQRRTDAAGFYDHRVGPGGVREQALNTLGTMLNAGVVADEQTFIIMMTAAAREGDMQTVKSFLKKVWDLDVDALLAGASEANIKPRKVPADSPLRPTGDLLNALALVFGINNDIPAALRVIDFAARQFAIDVPEETWSLLIEWTFVLAADRTGTSRQDGSKVGELPEESLVSLWETMTGAPYFVAPNMSMYNHLIKNLARRVHPTMLFEKMEEGHGIYLRHQAAAIQSRKELTAAIFGKSRRSTSNVSIENLRKEWEYNDIVRQRDIVYLKRWLRLLLGSMNSWTRVDSVYVTERLPTLLWNWRDMAPTTVRYETATGMVEFDIRTTEDVERNGEHIASTRYSNELLREAVPRFIGHDWIRGRLSRHSARARGPMLANDQQEELDSIDD